MVSDNTNGGAKTLPLIDLIDIERFNTQTVGAYANGTAEKGLAADRDLARSIIPPGTGSYRDFSYIAPEIPEFDQANCVGCMECVTQCPDTAILAKVVSRETLDDELSGIDDPEFQSHARDQFSETAKYYKNFEKKGGEPGMFGIFIDPTKCKGCAECVEACGDHDALKMISKTPENRVDYSNLFDVFTRLPETPDHFRIEKSVQDMMLADRALLYVGGAGSCMGCGEATAIRMMMAATGYVYGEESFGIVAATGCNTVYGSTYPYNPYMIPWTNSLFENAPADAMGIRARWDQQGWQSKRLWVLGGDGAMNDIGFQSLSRMFASGADIKVLVLDTQVYSNTGGQASTATFGAQATKMSFHGKVLGGKTERRKELANISMMHPDVYVAQTTAAHPNHFYKAVLEANEYPGPAIVNVYTTCQPEHGVGDNMAYQQAKMAVDSRAFPLFVHDPRLGDTMRERLSLRANPAPKKDWYEIPKTGERIDFVAWAKTEGRFKRHFDRDGKPSEHLLSVQQERLSNWHFLQDLAGVENTDVAAAEAEAAA